MELEVGKVYKSAIKVRLNGDLIQDDWLIFLVLGNSNHYYSIKILDCQCKFYKEGDTLTLVRIALIIANARPFEEEDDKMVKNDISHTPELIELFIDMALQTKDEDWFNQLMALKEVSNGKLS
jgi:hypothetical protein